MRVALALTAKLSGTNPRTRASIAIELSIATAVVDFIDLTIPRYLRYRETRRRRELMTALLGQGAGGRPSPVRGELNALHHDNERQPRLGPGIRAAICGRRLDDLRSLPESGRRR